MEPKKMMRLRRPSLCDPEFQTQGERLSWDKEKLRIAEDAWRIRAKAIGQICEECSSESYFHDPPGYPELCYDCKKRLLPEEVDFNTKIRCPYCISSFDPYECEMYYIMNEGEHEITCPECNKNFLIYTNVERTYNSPALEAKNEKSIANNTTKDKSTD